MILRFKDIQRSLSLWRNIMKHLDLSPKKVNFNEFLSGMKSMNMEFNKYHQNIYCTDVALEMFLHLRPSPNLSPFSPRKNLPQPTICHGLMQHKLHSCPPPCNLGAQVFCCFCTIMLPSTNYPTWIRQTKKTPQLPIFFPHRLTDLQIDIMTFAAIGFCQ